MQVKFFAYIRDYTGCKSIDFPYCKTIKDLTNSLCEKYGDKLRNKMLSHDGSKLGEEIIILVNGKNVVHLAGINTKLISTDVISIFPVVAGG